MVISWENKGRFFKKRSVERLISLFRSFQRKMNHVKEREYLNYLRIEEKGEENKMGLLAIKTRESFPKRINSLYRKGNPKSNYGGKQ